ncbi:uncharacterized protein NFIA_112620 [Aspergillus fischeri NRRL 181]|uniref:BYS1 domain protein n=1 Tax=Neosartorya fischeri (strain ATCC 1020 / DSM 3700 / CBS 544.65 / FGSC A1164 / JCM 1740 / NRRL 181 / WB 181) TaxID=331117 RepID=A1D8M7_NEOFI|nr:uncharacterized protein NFIA_112620 [Aspergillus fischeri NRRL 181]EAW20738.1 hypothetical protein NFIA_112620 [Aspergillus fischeri NRRL 181]KAG2002077.1 hypothetical protein GB937_009742 [Aspergillus fischeri]
MKYSVLLIAALVAPALGNPAYYWRHYLSRPIHLADAGTVDIRNDAPFDVDVDVEPQGWQFNIAPGDRHSVPGAPVADVKFNQQVEVSYVSGDQGTFNYVIQPIGNGFAGCVYVSPDGCGSLTWCAGDPPTHPVTCEAGTELPVTLFQPGYVSEPTISSLR